jgi:hypothetical protein
LHPPHGIDAVEELPASQTELPGLYAIPFRSLFSRNVPNLLFAGRNISATHVAFASTRVMATCAVMGQAIGTAAAQAVEKKLSLTELVEGAAMKELQQRLLKDDAYIPALRNEDPLDQARGAKVTASTEAPGREAALVLDGISRDLIGRFGAWADQKPHHWASQELPAWLELRLPSPTEVREIHLTFDTGFQRELLLTASDYTNKKIVRGPQPETIKAYRILADDVLVAEENDNYLRKRVHRLAAPILATTLKVEALSTHGLPEARIYEIRVY